MKQKPLIFIFAFILLSFLAKTTFADNLALAAKSTSPATKVAAPLLVTDSTTTNPADTTSSALTNDPTTIDINTLAKAPLSVKKQIVQDQLSAILVKLNDLSGRTQTAVTQLSTNNIDLSLSQTSLTDAQTNLAAAKVSLDALTALQVTSTSPKVKVATLKDVKTSVEKLETSLKIARDDLIQTLLTLKATIDPQSIAPTTPNPVQ